VAALVPVFMFCDKKKSWLALVAAVLMGASRNYVQVHYPSDVLGGIIIGLIAGLIAFFVVSFAMKKFAESKNVKANKVVSFDLIETVKARKAK
jgi:membrane-associated phospholipid phosphatase